MKVLLLHPLHEKLGVFTKRTSIDFPYGLAYIARFLEDNGFSVEVLDAQASQIQKKEVMVELLKRDFDVLGISAFCTQYNAVKIISSFVKEKLKKPIVIGGPLATHSAELTLRTTMADICVVGEGEITMLDLLNNMDNIGNVLGIAYKKEGEVVFNPPRPYIENLDILPRPAYHLFNMERYLNMNYFAPQKDEDIKIKSNDRQMSLIVARGCPYRCRFCARNFRGFRRMSMKRIVEEIKYIQNTFGVSKISFHDDLLFINEKEVREFASLTKGMNITWSSQFRINLATYKMLKLMKECGCMGVGFGVESGSQKILDSMNKMITVEQIEKALFYCKELKLPVKICVIFGYPGEDESTIQETIDLFKKVDYPIRKFNFITPYPGSALYDEAKKQGKIKDEAEYLTSIEKSTGRHRKFINFTKFPDDRLYDIMRETEKKIERNYYKRHLDKYFKRIFNIFLKKIMLI